ncbi:hypothetical protein DFAR_2460003 [Desulfarculales bacterium]
MLAQHMEGPCQVGLVAETDGRIIGFFLSEIKVGGFGSELTGWLEMVGVTSKQMGAGVGRTLARGILGYFAKQGVTEVLRVLLKCSRRCAGTPATCWPSSRIWASTVIP